MRLGWLSRLGIVLTVFGLPLTAGYFTDKEIRADIKYAETARDECVAIVGNPRFRASEAQTANAMKQCYDQASATIDAPTWPAWRANLIGAAIVFGLAWILALAIYWSIVWILAGRRRAAQ